MPRQRINPGPGWLTTQQVSEQLGVSQDVVRHLLQRGFLVGTYHPTGPRYGFWLVRETDADAYQRRNQNSTEPRQNEIQERTAHERLAQEGEDE